MSYYSTVIDTSYPLFFGERAVGTLFHRMYHRVYHLAEHQARVRVHHWVHHSWAYWWACCLLVQLLSGFLDTLNMVSICCGVAVKECGRLHTAARPGLTAALCVKGSTGIYCVCVVASIHIAQRSMVNRVRFPDPSSARRAWNLSQKQRYVNIVIIQSTWVYFQVLGGYVSL